MCMAQGQIGRVHIYICVLGRVTQTNMPNAASASLLVVVRSRAMYMDRCRHTDFGAGRCWVV